MFTMTNAHLSISRLRLIFSLLVLLFASLSLYSAPSVDARESGQADATAQDVTDVGDGVGATDVFVSEVQGAILKTDAGVMIDIANAFIFSIGGVRLDASAIKAGMRIRATLVMPPDSAAPIVAKFVEVRLDSEIVLVAPLQAIDYAGGSLTVLNRQIFFGDRPPLITSADQKKLKIGRTVTVVAKAEGITLVALRIYLGNNAAFAGAAIL